MTDRDRKALREALAEALDDLGYGFYAVEWAAQLVKHPAVVAALAGSGPEAGLRARVLYEFDEHLADHGESSYCNRAVVLGTLSGIALAATPTASPTDHTPDCRVAWESMGLACTCGAASPPDPETKP